MCYFLLDLAVEIAQMANEPDNLVLVQLREIRATLAEHSALMKEGFGQIGKRFEDFHALTSHTLTLGTANHLKSQEFERRHEFSEGEQRRMRDRMDDFERRLTTLEDKIDC
jgi:hypothetical protein